MNRAPLVLLLLSAGCGNQSRGVRLDINFHSSCTTSPGNYNIECVSAVEAWLLDKNSETLESDCTELDSGAFQSAYELVKGGELVPVLENIRPRENVMIELRGYHGIVRDACREPESPLDDLMFWGRSGLVDLTDESLEKIDIDIECRAGCDCKELDDNPACPLALAETTRVCSPPLRCRQTCNGTSECWDSAMPCSNNECQPYDEQMCFACDSANDCGEGLVCVRHTTDYVEDFCAKICPLFATGLDACPGKMGCLTVDGEKLTLLP